MFFASFPMPTSTAAMQILPPNQLRAQVSALFLLISNLIGLGLGTTAVALLTDRWFRDPAAVGQSLSALIGAAAVACVVLLAMGCGSYRRSLAAEATPGAVEASDGATPLTAPASTAATGWRRGATIRRGSGDATGAPPRACGDNPRMTYQLLKMLHVAAVAAWLCGSLFVSLFLLTSQPQEGEAPRNARCWARCAAGPCS